MSFASTMAVSDVHKWIGEGGKGCNWCHWRGGRKIRLSLFIRLVGTSMLMLLPLCEKLNLVMLVHKSIGHRQKWLMNKQNDSVQLDNYWFSKACSVISSKHLLPSLALGGFFWCLLLARSKHEIVEAQKKRVSGYYKPIKADKWRNEFSLRFGFVLLFHGGRENRDKKKEGKARSHINLEHAKTNPHTNFSGVKAMYCCYVCF